MKRCFGRLTALLAVLMLLGSFSCRTDTVTTLNTSETFYSDYTLFEATARELTIDGHNAEVRIRFVNLSDAVAETLLAKVLFLDADGNTLYTDSFHETLDYPLAVGDSVAFTASCYGNNTKKIVGIAVVSVDD